MNKKIELTIDIIGRYVEAGLPVVKSMDSGEYELEHFLYISYYERFICALDSILILLKEYTVKPYMENSIGLIIRSSLLDFMTLSYILSIGDDVKYGKKNKRDLDTTLNTIATDHLINTFSYLKLFKTIGKIAFEEYKEAIDAVHYTYNYLFNEGTVNYENPKKNLIIQKTLSVSDLHNRLHENPATQNLSDVYDLYTYYSKYEHFGIMTNFMQQGNPDNSIDILLEGLAYLILGGQFSLATLTFIKYAEMDKTIELFEISGTEYTTEVLSKIDK